MRIALAAANAVLLTASVLLVVIRSGDDARDGTAMLQAAADRTLAERFGRVQESVLVSIDGTDTGTVQTCVFDAERLAFSGHVHVRETGVDENLRLDIRRIGSTVFLHSDAWTGRKQGKWLRIDDTDFSPFLAPYGSVSQSVVTRTHQLIGELGADASSIEQSDAGSTVISTTVPPEAGIQFLSLRLRDAVGEAVSGELSERELPARVLLGTDRSITSVTVDMTELYLLYGKVTDRFPPDASLDELKEFGLVFNAEVSLSRLGQQTSIRAPQPSTVIRPKG